MGIVIVSVVGMIFAFIGGYFMGRKFPEKVMQETIDKVKDAVSTKPKIKIMPFKPLLTAEEETFKKVKKKFENE